VGSESTLNKGLALELLVSKRVHRNNQVLLISSLFLRRNNLGQIDLSYFKNKILYLVEVKSSRKGILKFYSSSQFQKYQRTGEYLSLIFDIDSIQIKTVSK
jgi:Holliday junction resolvase-like predicted endonuclease